MSKLNKKTPYPYNDVVVFEKVESEIHFQYIRNERGEYVDIRRYANNRPTLKGIRMPVETFNSFLAYYEESKDDEKKEDKKDPHESTVFKKKK